MLRDLNLENCCLICAFVQSQHFQRCQSDRIGQPVDKTDSYAGPVHYIFLCLTIEDMLIFAIKSGDL